MERALFPMNSMRITQGYDTGTHKGTYALDLAGVDSSIDLVYAPFTGTIKAIDSKNGNFIWLESNDKVLCSNGQTVYLTAMFGHSNNIDNLKVGQTINQWDSFYSEGTAGNATGNHVHFELATGKYEQKYIKNSSGIYMIPNAVKPNEYVFLKKETNVLNGNNYNWIFETEEKDEKLYLPKSAKSWRVYELDKKPIKGNEKGFLKPSKFGGLEYDIIEMKNNNVAVIKTRDFGTVQIYVDKSTGAIIK